MAEPADAYALNEDGSAKDPVAFKEALKSDASKMEALKNESEVLKIVEGDDIPAFQDLIKSVYQVRNLAGMSQPQPLRARPLTACTLYFAHCRRRRSALSG